jgi:hypothetical protein
VSISIAGDGLRNRLTSLLSLHPLGRNKISSHCFYFPLNFSITFVMSVRAQIAVIAPTAAKPLTSPAMQSPTQAPIPNMQTSALDPDDFDDCVGDKN